MENKIQLSPKKILNKVFPVDFKGYNAAEVDYFLDIVMNDYQAFEEMLADAIQEINRLTQANEALEEQLNNLERENSITKENLRTMEENMSNNVDLLKRLSLLEKEVFQKD